MKLAVIVAKARNRVIGIDNQLPWRLPTDLKYFKEVTSGKPVIMGRKTFESIGRPLPKRQNIVVTRDPNWHYDGVHTVFSLTEATQLARSYAENSQVDEIMVIGGAQIYAQALPLADVLYITEVQAELDGDAVFPELVASEWVDIEPPIHHGADDQNSHDFRILKWRRNR